MERIIIIINKSEKEGRYKNFYMWRKYEKLKNNDYHLFEKVIFYYKFLLK